MKLIFLGLFTYISSENGKSDSEEWNHYSLLCLHLFLESIESLIVFALFTFISSEYGKSD